MNVAKQCKDRFEDIVALVMGELDPPTAAELQVHIAVCDSCRAGYDALVEEEKEVRSGFEALARSLEPVERVVLQEQGHQSRVRVGVSNKHFLERVRQMILRHKRLSAAAAAVLAALAASVVLYVSLFTSSGPAYALEQTGEANTHIMSYHVKITPAPIDRMGEAWIVLDPDGTVSRARLDIFTADDGPKTSVVSKEKAEVWFKMKHFHLVLSDKPTRERLFGALVAMRASFDPKLAFEQLQADQKAGNVEVETRGPMKKGQPITLTVTSKKTPDKKELYHVDPQTKLVERVFELHRKGDRWQVTQMREYLDYNKEFDPGVFQLGAPQGTVTIDQIKNKVGLDQGALTDEEIAKKVAKEFFEAVIAGEYQKASPLLSGLPAEQVKKIFEPPQVKLLRIVEIGKPTPHSYTRSLKVPVKVEVEVNGEKLIKEFSPFVRQEAGGWTIIGGL